MFYNLFYLILTLYSHFYIILWSYFLLDIPWSSTRQWHNPVVCAEHLIVIFFLIDSIIYCHCELTSLYGTLFLSHGLCFPQLLLCQLLSFCKTGFNSSFSWLGCGKMLFYYNFDQVNSKMILGEKSSSLHQEVSVSL